MSTTMGSPKGLKSDLNGNIMHISMPFKCSYKERFTIKARFHSVLKISEYLTLSSSHFPSWAMTKYFSAKTGIFQCKKYVMQSGK
jgi:hypothetical protein